MLSTLEPRRYESRSMKEVTDLSDVIKQTGAFESFDGTPVYYEVRGTGRPIVLCYGIACPMNHWSHQLRYFSKNYQTIVFDYRGHHRTPAPQDRANLSMEAICRDIQGLMNHLGLQKASFWGHSYGVQLILRFYDMSPEFVENLVFINGFAKNPINGLFGFNAAEPLFRLFKEAHRKFPTILSTAWKTAVLSPLAIPITSLAGGFNLSLTNLKDVEVYTRGVASMDLEVFTILFDEMLNYDGTPVLDKIDVPTLIISGNKDGVTPREHQELLHERIRSSQLLRVPYGSHCTQLDMPEFVNLRIEKFLNEAGYSPQSQIRKGRKKV